MQVPTIPILIAGPTGVGKSLFAVELAGHLSGEIIGVDAFQIYKGLEVLTAQPSEALQQRVPHHLIGALPVTEAFDVAAFLVKANSLATQIGAVGQTPILCGGTGLYFKAFTHGLDLTPPPDANFREVLSRLSASELREKLFAIDPDACRIVDVQNPRRMIRAIEICSATGKPLSAARQRWDFPPREHLGFLLMRDREELRARIQNNVVRLFETGAIEEVAKTRATAHSNARKAIGFHLIESMLDGRLSREECIERCIHATWQYAKRQLTWFRNQTTFITLDMTRLSTMHDAVEYVLEIVDRRKGVTNKE